MTLKKEVIMLDQNFSDQELLKQYRSGNDSALETLILRYKDKVYTTIYFLVRDRNLAEDFFQETFIKVINTLREGRYKEEGKFVSWVTMIARNLCIDYFRKKKRVPGITYDGDSDIMSYLRLPSENAEDRIIKDETSVEVRKLIDTLPSEQKEVVILRHYADLSFKEISKLTNVSINTALGRMRYALNNIRKVMEAKKVAI